jgi:DNA-binding MarR family transcriptional regulator
VLDRLEEARFIHRERDPNDRRKVIVSRNEEEIDARVNPQYAPQAEGMVAMLREYDDDQLALIADFLSRISRPRP